MIDLDKIPVICEDQDYYSILCGGAYCHYRKDGPVVIIDCVLDDLLNRYSDGTRDFIIAHEKAHIALGHHLRMDSLEEDNLSFEKEADLHAVVESSVNSFGLIRVRALMIAYFDDPRTKACYLNHQRRWYLPNLLIMRKYNRMKDKILADLLHRANLLVPILIKSKSESGSWLGNKAEIA
jgi:hypothetical protein